MNNFSYVGKELELFAAAQNWKSYWSGEISRFVNGATLEVGAGLGANTSYLDHGRSDRWVCLEPDPQLAKQLSVKLEQVKGARKYEIVCGTVQDLDKGKRFDTIIYIDVLEHIEDDRRELENAVARLRAGGRLIVLSPAHQWLYSPFDSAIGHFRRYNRRMVRSISPVGTQLEKLIYLDSVGLGLSVANTMFLHQMMPTKGQVAFWDAWIVPVSRIIDRYLFNAVGKSIVAIWQRVEP